MNTHEAEDLAVKIAQTWPKGIAAHIWEEELLPLDTGRAGTAFVKLRREAKYPPTIADFLERYNAIQTDPADRVECKYCDTSGWVDKIGYHGPNCGTRTGHACNCRNGVEPCACPEGDRARQSRTWTQRPTGIAA